MTEDHEQKEKLIQMLCECFGVAIDPSELVVIDKNGGNADGRFYSVKYRDFYTSRWIAWNPAEYGFFPDCGHSENLVQVIVKQ